MEKKSIGFGANLSVNEQKKRHKKKRWCDVSIVSSDWSSMLHQNTRASQDQGRLALLVTTLNICAVYLRYFLSAATRHREKRRRPREKSNPERKCRLLINACVNSIFISAIEFTVSQHAWAQQLCLYFIIFFFFSGVLVQFQVGSK